MKGAHFVFVGVWMGIWTVTRGLLIPRALHSPTIILEEYGVVLKPVDPVEVLSAHPCFGWQCGV